MITKRKIAFGLTLILRLSMITLFAAAAGPQPSLPPSLEHLSPPDVLDLKGVVFHVQGLDVDDDFIYMTSVDRDTHRGLLHKFTRKGDLVATVDLTNGPRYHTSGLALEGQWIWVATAEYRAGSSSRITQIDKTTLQIVSSFMVNDHIGAVTADGSHVYGVNWDAARIYSWDHAGHMLANTPNLSHVAYQDMKVVGDAIVASGFIRGQPTGAVDWLDPVTLLPLQRLDVSRTGEGPLWTREGMALHDGKFYFLPDDGRNGHVQVYSFDMLQLQAAAGTPRIDMASAR